MSFVFPLHSVFLALPLESQPKWHFQALQEELRPWEDILGFQNPQSPHLTLMFWPQVLELELQGIRQQSAKIASRHAPFSVRANGVGTFGNRGEDFVLYLDVAFSDELARVKKSCPWSDGKPFHPHITIARIRHPQKFAVHRKKIMKVMGNVSFEVLFDCLRLYAEVEGQKQTPLQDFAFTLHTTSHLTPPHELPSSTSRGASSEPRR